MSNFVQFRADPELLRQLDAFVEEMRLDAPEATRSAAVRVLVAQALSRDDARIRARELLRQVYAQLQPTVREIVSRIRSILEELPIEIADEL